MEIWWIVLIVVAIVALVSIVLAVGNFASEKFVAEYEKLFQMPAQAHKTVLEFITEQNYQKHEGKLKIARTQKPIGDAYNHKHKALVLTDKTLSSNSAGAFAIVAHELGHAEQDLTSKKFMMMKVLRATGWVVGKLFLPAVIACIVLLFFENLLTYAIVVGGVAAAIFIFAAVIKLITISIEKDASKRAISMLNEFLPDNVMKSVKKFLKSAKLTYWSDLVRLLFGWSGLVRKTKMFK